jgi:serpin B
MIKSITIIIFVLSTFMLTAQKNLPKSINSLSFNLLNKLNTENENVLISAYSISGALALTYVGAKNETKSEMEKVLFPYIKNKVGSDFQTLNESLSFNKKLELLTANAIWLEKAYKLKKRYAKEISENFKSELNKADFVSVTGRDSARNEINRWVEEKTKEMITDFIPPDVLSASTTMVLVNAIYYLGKWNTAFPKQKSYKADFKSSKEKKVVCEFMKNTLNLTYYSDSLLRAVEIPYEDNEASLIVVLPKNKSTKLSGLLDNNYFGKIYRGFKNRKVELHLPKFKLESEYELNSYLKELGLKSAFDASADFSGITGKKEIHISNILHKAVMVLDESGTEASAATAVITSRSVSNNYTKPVLFKADYPFIFLIREKSTGTILFMGNLVEPTTL